MKPQQIGILDMGSNSIRFVVYNVNQYAVIKEILNLKVVARLSSYINHDGAMTKQGIAKILETLKRFSHITTNYQFTTLKAVATAAVRNATNKDEILRAIHTHSDFNVQVLSEDEEAYYGYLAVTNSTNIVNGITVDIGGGSTEITLFENRELVYSHSFPFGAVTLKSFITSEEPTSKEINDLQRYLIDQYKQLPWLLNKHLPIIGIGGSARNLALIHQRKIAYPIGGLHQYEMTSSNIDTITDDLVSMTLKQRQHLDGLSKDRADIIIPAAIAIQSLITFASAKEFIISNNGLRDGLFSEIYLRTIGIRHYPIVAEESLYQLSSNYDLNFDDKKQLSITASQIAKELNCFLQTPITKNELKLLRWSAKIYNIGAKINSESKSQHTFYLLTNQTINGLSHEERLSIAAIASFKSRSQLKQYLEPFKRMVTKEAKQRYGLLGAILKLSAALNHTNRKVIQSIRIEKSHHQLIFYLRYKGDAYFEQLQAQKNKKHLEKATGYSITFSFRSLF